MVTGDIPVTTAIAGANDKPLPPPQRKQPLAAAVQVTFKNFAPFKDCRTEINDTFGDYGDFINIALPMYNLIEYSDNYSDSSGSLWSFKRDDRANNANVTNDDNAPSFKYKASIIGNTEDNGRKNGVKIAVPLKYLSNFWRSLEMPLINCKVELSLKWVENCVLTTAAIGANATATGADSATFEIADTKLSVPVVTLSTEDNVKLVKQLNEIPVYWSKYKVIDIKVVEIAAANEEKHIREQLDSRYQGVKRFFVLAYDNTVGNNQISNDSFKKYYLLRFKIENYNIDIDGRNVSDQPINDLIQQYDEVIKISTGQGDDYATGCLLDFAYFEKNYRLTAVNLSKQKALDTDSKAIQQIVFTGKIK